MKNNFHNVFALFAASFIAGALSIHADDSTTNTNAAAAAAKSAADAKLEELFPDVVVARGKGVEIKRSRLDEAVTGYRASFTARGIPLGAGDIPLLEKSAFDHLVEIQLLDSIATADDKEKAQKEADAQVDNIRKRAGSEDLFNAQLKSLGLSLDQFRARVMEEAVATQVLRKKVSVSDEQVRKFYEDNPLKFEQPELVRVSHFSISTVDASGLPVGGDELKARKKIADDALRSIKGGEDFAALEKKYADDKSGNVKVGEIAPFAKGQNQIPKEIESAAFSLQSNQVSDIITTKYGFHIIKLDEKMAPKKYEFSEVTNWIKANLENSEMQRVLPTITSQLRKDADIQVLDDQVKSLLEEADAKLKASEAKQNMPIPLPTNSTPK